MKSLIEILKLSTGYLRKHQISHARRQAEDLLCDALHLKRIDLYTNFDRPLNESELEVCRDRLARRAKHEPLQYIHGEVEFYHGTFKVTPAVLIPRQETEILVDKIYQELVKLPPIPVALWDLCCGSGCIGISLKKQLPHLQVTLSDISEEALKIARHNAHLNQVEVEFLQGDLLDPFQEKKATYVVCNPPYIAERELNDLDLEVKSYEPHLALISGKTGLEFYERLARQLPSYLLPHAKVWLEIGKNQAEPITKLFNHSPWIKWEHAADWSGHDRFFFLEIE